jgi:hypothetical protein
MTIIRDWIELGTTVMTDCWGAYRDLGSQGYTHRTVNHSMNFVDPVSGAHTNTIEATWRSVKVFLGQYNRGEVQGRRRTIFSTIPSSRREHQLVSVPCSPQNCPRHVKFLTWSPPYEGISAIRYAALNTNHL